MNNELLIKIAKTLNNTQCTWAIGGSVLLNKYNLVDKPRDIDILINAKDAQKIKANMNKIGKSIEVSTKKPFLTKEFFAYRVEDIDVEFLGDFGIDLGENYTYKFLLDEKYIMKIDLEGSEVKFSALEDWLVAYKAMNDPKQRVHKIENYFINNSVINKEILARYFDTNLSPSIKIELQNVLDNIK